jgi:hypothetical protein
MSTEKNDGEIREELTLKKRMERERERERGRE